MKELLEILRVATGADRGIDGAIEVAVRRIEAARTGLAPEQWAKWESDHTGWVRDPHTIYASEAVTASLDAALALVERVLPGASWLVSHVVRSRWSKHAFWATCGSGAGKYEAYAPAAPLALLIALLGALGAVSEASVQSTDEDRKTNNNPSLSKPNQ